MILNQPHALLQRGVLHRDAEYTAIGPLFLLCSAIDQIVIVLVRLGSEAARGLVLAVDPLPLLHVATLFVRERLVRMEIDAPCPAAVIVDRHPDVTAERVLAERGDKRVPGEQPLGDAPIV